MTCMGDASRFGSNGQEKRMRPIRIDSVIDCYYAEQVFCVPNAYVCSFVCFSLPFWVFIVFFSFSLYFILALPIRCWISQLSLCTCAARLFVQYGFDSEINLIIKTGETKSLKCANLLIVASKSCLNNQNVSRLHGINWSWIIYYWAWNGSTKYYSIDSVYPVFSVRVFSIFKIRHSNHRIIITMCCCS